MAFGYHFVDLTKPEKEARRRALDNAASVAQWSAVIPLLVVQLYFLAQWLSFKLRKGDEESSPSSPYLKQKRLAGKSWAGRLPALWRSFRWRLSEPVIEGWGTKGEWCLAALWTVWLLGLCVYGAGEDYLHLTKRFGIVGASQLPIHYLLAIKSPYSPITLLTRLSHEELNIGHQMLGRIVLFLFTLHAAFYMNFFVLSGFLAKRIRDRDVIVGIISISSFAVLGTTALGYLRRWNYRVFYITHVTLAVILLPLLYFHVHHIRQYIWQTLVVFLIGAMLRFFNTHNYAGDIFVVPNTDLIHVRIPLGLQLVSTKSRKWQPGQHVYLTLPQHPTTPSGLLHTLKHSLLMNPFTIASLPTEDKQLVLVARTMSGNTKELHRLAKLTDQHMSQVPLHVEGPYGGAARLPDLRSFDQVLLIAGGVGVTYTFPIWRSMHAATDTSADATPAVGRPRVRFLWAVRNLSETRWVSQVLARHESGERKERIRDGAIEIYVTRTAPEPVPAKAEDDVVKDEAEGIELSEREQLLEESEGDALKHRAFAITYERPNLANIVEETIAGSNGKIAVLFCGPARMGTQLRKSVGKWIMLGADVYWHAEAFGL